VTRIYDAEPRQHSLMRLLGRVGEVRQSHLGEMASLDETTLTRNLRPLETSGCGTIRAGADHREKLVAITEAG
jgi:DNA-binding MarR family transcriptional regulator